MRLLPLLTLSLTAVTSLRACTLEAPLASPRADVRAADDARYSSQPSPRAGAVVALTANATTLLFGGVLSSGELALPSVYEFNAGLNRWAQLLTDGTATSPAARTGHCGGWVADSMVVFGGRDANGSPLADAWLFAPVTQRWTLLQTPGVTPPPRAGHSCLVVNKSSLLGACSPALYVLLALTARAALHSARRGLRASRARRRMEARHQQRGRKLDVAQTSEWCSRRECWLPHPSCRCAARHCPFFAGMFGCTWLKR